MKKVWIVCLAMALFSMMTAAALSAQVYVRVRPAVPVYVRATPPGAGYIWIGEDWEWRGGQYIHVGGRWVYPPHPGFVWVPGHWRHTRFGWQWFGGRWRGRGRRW